MPGASDIQRRIKSVKNTKKITKAMEMVASSKMRRAVNGVLSTRPYADLAWSMILNVAQKTNASLHPLLSKRSKVKKIGLVIITSNRGLCGSFNQQTAKVAKDFIKENKGIDIEIIAIGKKGARSLARAGHNVVAEFEKDDVLNE